MCPRLGQRFELQVSSPFSTPHFCYSFHKLDSSLIGTATARDPFATCAELEMQSWKERLGRINSVPEDRKGASEL